MASLPVIEYFRTAITAAWTHTPIFWPNEQPFEPDNSAAYLAVEFPVASETITSIGAPGSNYVPEEGAVVIDLAIPLGAGLNPVGSPWTQRIDDLRAALRGKNSSDGAVVTFDASPSVPMPTENVGMFTLSFAIAYRFCNFG
jgi:hypothetical protein